MLEHRAALATLIELAERSLGDRAVQSEIATTYVAVGRVHEAQGQLEGQPVMEGGLDAAHGAANVRLWRTGPPRVEAGHERHLAQAGRLLEALAEVLLGGSEDAVELLAERRPVLGDEALGSRVLLLVGGHGARS